MTLVPVEVGKSIRSVAEARMELKSEMEKALPLYAFPTQHLLKVIHKDNPDLSLRSRLEITSIIDAGDEGGIMCGPLLKNQVILLSLTHLEFKEEHPLKDRINTYKTSRINLLRAEELIGNITTGRNNPCSFGSGKKYKNCCGG